MITIEPSHEKTCLWGFRPGPTQTELCGYRRWLEAWNFGFRKLRHCTIYVAKTKVLRSYCAADLRLCLRICKNTVFPLRDTFCWSTTGCGKPPDVYNTYCSMGVDTIGSQRKYECNSGYYMRGSGVIKCLKSGHWSKSQFSCHRKYHFSRP